MDESIIIDYNRSRSKLPVCFSKFSSAFRVLGPAPPSLTAGASPAQTAACAFQPFASFPRRAHPLLDPKDVYKRQGADLLHHAQAVGRTVHITGPVPRKPPGPRPFGAGCRQPASNETRASPPPGEPRGPREVPGPRGLRAGLPSPSQPAFSPPAATQPLPGPAGASLRYAMGERPNCARNRRLKCSVSSYPSCRAISPMAIPCLSRRLAWFIRV